MLSECLGALKLVEFVQMNCALSYLNRGNSKKEPFEEILKSMNKNPELYKCLLKKSEELQREDDL